MEPPREGYHHHHHHNYHHRPRFNHQEQHHQHHHPNYFQHPNQPHFQPPPQLPLQPPLPLQPQLPLPPQPQLPLPLPPQIPVQPQPPPPPPYPYFNNDHYQCNNQNFDVRPNFDANHQMTGPPNAPVVGGGFFSNGLKRARCQSGRPGSPDHNVDAGNVKLFVAPIPIPTTMEAICPLFEAHGGVIEVVLPRDKRSGQQQGYCFVKYATIEEADRAIRALHGQYTIPGETVPLKVRYADRERERAAKVERERPAVEMVEKLYVGSVSRQASMQEIEEIFSPYGHVVDVYIVRDNLKQSRGCAFVKFTHRDMALAAKKALHGTFTMRGCDQPLIIRFADPPKRRPGELRGCNAYDGQNSGSYSQGPMIRPPPRFGDSMGGCVLPTALYPVQEASIISEPLAVPNQVKLMHAAPQIITQPLVPVKQQSAQLSQMSLQQTRGPEKFSQTSQPAVNEMVKQIPNLEQQQSVRISLESPCSEGNRPAVGDKSSASVGPQNPQIEDPQDCEWSEHNCPDGCKYYYNCTTCESRWERPHEFALFQQQLQKKQKTHNPSQQPCFLSEGFSDKEADHTSSIRNSTSTSLALVAY